jgi:phenylpropionate dioxygenase-like ring-hydroxylating dioxygenase large terminal subunit
MARAQRLGNTLALPVMRRQGAMPMTFIKNCWYVASWSHEVEAARPVGRQVAGDAFVLYRTEHGSVVAFEDSCPHRRAPLSLGRVEGNDLRCMYHGMKFRPDGACIEMPGSEKIPSRARVRAVPVVERDNWVWVWPGDPALAKPELIPVGFGSDGQDWKMSFGQLDYNANYELVNDNLCDGSHIAFLHENTLGKNMGRRFCDEHPTVTRLERGVRVDRNFTNQRVVAPWVKTPDSRVDVLTTYDFLVPGIFLFRTGFYEPGSAARIEAGKLTTPPYFERVDQQAVTPLTDRTTRYYYAAAHKTQPGLPEMLGHIFGIMSRAFEEDRVMIEAQQRIWDRPGSQRAMIATAHDEAPMIMRGVIERLLAAEVGVLP